VVCRHGDAAGAPDLVCLTAQTAFGSGFFNEIFRCVPNISDKPRESSRTIMRLAAALLIDR
jgi:hypothetical protein